MLTRLTGPHPPPRAVASSHEPADQAEHVGGVLQHARALSHTRTLLPHTHYHGTCPGFDSVLWWMRVQALLRRSDEGVAGRVR